MNENTLIARNPKHLTSRLENEVVMMNPDTGKYFNLNETGSLIWDLLAEGPLTLGSLAEKLTVRYQVSQENCLADLIRFAEGVQAKGIFILSGPGSNGR